MKRLLQPQPPEPSTHTTNQTYYPPNPNQNPKNRNDTDTAALSYFFAGTNVSASHPKFLLSLLATRSSAHPSSLSVGCGLCRQIGLSASPGGRNLAMLPPIGSIVKPTFFIAAVNVVHGMAPRESERKSLRKVLMAVGDANIGSAFGGGLGREMVPSVSGAGMPWVLGLVRVLVLVVLGWVGSTAGLMKGSKGTFLLC